MKPKRPYKMKKKRAGLLTKEDRERMKKALKRLGLYGRKSDPWNPGPVDW